MAGAARRAARPRHHLLRFFIGAAVMALGGVAELCFGVKAAGKQLEDLAEPLAAADAAPDGPEVTEERSADEEARAQPAAGNRPSRGAGRREPRPGSRAPRRGGAHPRADPAPPPTRAHGAFVATDQARGASPPRASPPLRFPRTNKPSKTRSKPSSGLWTNTAPPNVGSSPDSSARATGAPASFAKRCGGRSPTATFSEPRATRTRRPTTTAMPSHSDTKRVQCRDTDRRSARCKRSRLTASPYGRSG